MQLELFSGGPEQTVGIMVIDDLSISTASGPSGKPGTLLFSSRFEVAKELDQPLAVPRGWMRDGSKPSTALLLRSDELKPLHVLAVVDTDPNTWGAWRTDPDSSVAVHPGDTLTLQWNEMYSIGWGGPAEAEYSYLPPGQYQFRIQGVTEAGEKTDAMFSLPITVWPPFWQTTWFRGSVLALLVAGLVAVVRYVTWRKMQVQLEQLNQQRAVELERSRIARDIHDDLGANLTQIALLSELAQTDLAQPAQARAHLERIFTTAGALARQLDEIVWAITPANDTLEQFSSYVSKYAQDYLRAAGIRCRLEVPESLPKYPMSSAQRHDLFLAAKEALHNVVKHAQADEVWLRLKIENGSLALEIQDNGKGLGEHAKAGARGHGLANMQNRLRHVGGTFEPLTRAGLGTLVRLTLPFKQ
jgi:signal transduction histidine kinase